MDKALNYLSLARKAGRVELGEEPVGAAARSGHTRLVIVASDASEHTWHRAKGAVEGSGDPCIQVPFSKEQLGLAVGRSTLALAAFTDPALALAFVKALGTLEPNSAVLTKLSERTRRVRQRQQEEKNHRRNVRSGVGSHKAGMKKN